MPTAVPNTARTEKPPYEKCSGEDRCQNPGECHVEHWLPFGPSESSEWPRDSGAHNLLLGTDYRAVSMGHSALPHFPSSRFLTPNPVAILVRQRVRVSRASYLPLDAFPRDRLATDIAGPSGPPSNGRGATRPTQAAVRESLAYALPQLIIGRLRAHRRCDRKQRAEPPLRHSLCFSLPVTGRPGDRSTDQKPTGEESQL
jgi:hypothetical protein